MAATTQDLKDFFALAGHTVTNSQLQSLAAWFTSITGIENPTPDDFISHIHTTFEQQVISHKRSTSTPVWD